MIEYYLDLSQAEQLHRHIRLTTDWNLYMINPQRPEDKPSPETDIVFTWKYGWEYGDKNHFWIYAQNEAAALWLEMNVPDGVPRTETT